MLHVLRQCRCSKDGSPKGRKPWKNAARAAWSDWKAEDRLLTEEGMRKSWEHDKAIRGLCLFLQVQTVYCTDWRHSILRAGLPWRPGRGNPGIQALFTVFCILVSFWSIWYKRSLRLMPGEDMLHFCLLFSLTGKLWKKLFQTSWNCWLFHLYHILQILRFPLGSSQNLLWRSLLSKTPAFFSASVFLPGNFSFEAVCRWCDYEI